MARNRLDHLGPALRAGTVSDYRSMVRRHNAARKVQTGLAELRIESPALATGLVGLVAAFLDQIGQREAYLRVEMTRSRSCPKFHCDNEHVRLVTTYLGPATKYQFVGENATHAAPLYGLVFLKGRRHPTHRDSVHHRSPELPDEEKRMCVAIDY